MPPTIVGIGSVTAVSPPLFLIAQTKKTLTLLRVMLLIVCESAAQPLPATPRLQACGSGLLFGRWRWSPCHSAGRR